MTDAPTVNDTARSLLAFFGTMAEWGERGTIGVHGASPELKALVCAVLDIVPAAWHPYPASLERDDGYVNLYQPTSDTQKAEMGAYDRHMAVHSVPRPPRYVDRDPGQSTPSSVDKAVVAALAGLASIRSVTRAGKLHEIERLMAEGRIPPDRVAAMFAESSTERSSGCARVMVTLTDEEIERAEHDDLGGEGG